MSLVDEVAIWSAIAGRMTTEMEINLALHAEERTRNAILVEETESFIWIMKRAAGEWHRALGYLRREHATLSEKISEEKRRAAAEREMEEMRRQSESRETANALRREVDTLTSLRDKLRDEVAYLQSAQQSALYSGSSTIGGAGVSRGIHHSSGSAAEPNNNNNDKANIGNSNTSSVYSSRQAGQHAATAAPAAASHQPNPNNISSYSQLGSPIAASQHDTSRGQYATAAPVVGYHSGPSSSYGGGLGSSGGGGLSQGQGGGASSLGVLRSVRDQLREIRENSNVSPVRGSTPQRASSPSAQQWKERLSKLQGDLRTLRSELGATPQRPPATAGY